MKIINKSVISTILLFLSVTVSLYAQQSPPPGGPPRGGRGGFDPDEMIKREKQNVYKVVTDLSDDQKMLLDGIYEEYGQSFKELREEMRQSRDFQSMRPKLMALREEKDGLIKDVLNEEQYGLYQGVIENRRNQMRQSIQRRRDRRNQMEELPSEQSQPEESPSEEADDSKQKYQ
jgi:hypothetical protein